MGLSEGSKEEFDIGSLSLEYMEAHSVMIFSAEVMNQILGIKETFLADHYELLPPLSAEIQENNSNSITVYFKDQNGNFKELTFSETNYVPKADLTQRLNEIGFNIEPDKLKLFGIPAREAKYILREKRFNFLTKGPPK